MSNRPANTIATLTIYYESYSGELTQRGVSVTDFDEEQMTGLCHLRERERTFRYDRVRSCSNAKTGEVVRNINQYLMEHYRQTVRYTLDVLYRNHPDALKVLLYVAKADGQVRAPELKVVAGFLKVITRDFRIDEGSARELLYCFDAPSLHGFKVAVGRVAARGNAGTSRSLVLACRAIVNTGKTITAVEQEALDYLDKRLPIE
ncbi:tellurite resistance TerB family protein [Metapseudomonas otitidis]|uniref:hypothetical protein n=1 Tax=Metapseudomonas otitidis TaxID=319939 RepID=UPI00366DC326